MKFVRFTKKDNYLLTKENHSVENFTELGISPMDFDIVVPFSKIDFLSNYTDMISFINECDDNMIEKISELLKSIKNNSKLLTDCLNPSEIYLLSPIEKPIHDVICVGVNYRAHLEECDEKMSMIHAPSTVYFSKRATYFKGPDEDIDAHLKIDSELDYEVELAVIIGKNGKNISKEKSDDYIFGYSILNDISARSLQRSHSQWYRGKSLDGFTAFGPCIVHKSAFDTPVSLNIKSYVNGEIRQSSNTSYLIKDIPSLIEEFSTGITLEAGDIIATGTPSGVGMGFDPPKYMQSGDTIRCEIEKIGSLTNRII